MPEAQPSLFAARRLTFTFTASTVTVFGEVALERLSYTAIVVSLTDRGETEDIGKGLHVYSRRLGGRWELTQDIWNSDLPPTRSNAD